MSAVLQYTIQVGRDALVLPGALSGSKEYYLDAWATGLRTGGFQVAYVIREGNPFIATFDDVGYVETGAFANSTPVLRPMPAGLQDALSPTAAPSMSFTETPAGFVVAQTGETRALLFDHPSGIPGWYVTSDGEEIRASLVDAQGGSSLLPVAPTDAGDQAEVAVAARWVGERGFAIAWQDTSQSFLPPGGTGTGAAVARLYGSDGAPVTDAFAVAGQVTGDARQSAPSIAANGGVGYVVAWTDGTGLDGDGESVRARLVGPDGSMTEPDFQLNQTAAGLQRDVSVVGLPGGFAAAWASSTPQGTWNTVVRVYDRSGVPRTDEIAIAMPASSLLVAPELTTLYGGGFAVAFGAADGTDQRIFLQGFGPTGATAFAPVPVGDQARIVDAATLPDGRVVVIGTERFELGLYAHVYDARTAGLHLEGTDGDDGYVGSAFFDDIMAGDGNDTVYGMAGNDHLAGGAGQDLLFGGDGADFLSGGRGGGISLCGGEPLEARMGSEWRPLAVADGPATAFSVAWMSSSGEIAFWTRDADGDAALAPISGRLGSEWRFSGLLDADGRGAEALAFADALGRIAVWQPFGPAPTLGIVPGRMGAEWALAGFGDLDGMQGEEAIWIGPDRTVAIWTFDARSGAVALAVTDARMGPEWSFVATGDLYADGTDDLIWRNDAGAVAVLNMSGARTVGVRVLDETLAGGAVTQVRDMDRDGRDDLVVATASGDAAVWLTRLTGVEVSQLGGHMGPGWSLLGASDGSGGLHPDLLWELGGAAYAWRLARDGDVLSGGPGPDLFGFSSLDFAGATISDFTPGQDRIALQTLALPEPGEIDPMTASRLSIERTDAGAVLRIDADPDPAVADWVALVTLQGVQPEALTSADLLL